LIDYIQEMKQVLRTKKVSAPLTTTVRGFEYYTKTSRYGIVYCRKRKSSMAKEVKNLVTMQFPYARKRYDERGDSMC
jgi:hypothetical protein